MTRRLLAPSALALCLGVLGFAAGCDEKLSDVAGPSPGLTPTFSSIQENIFESSDSSGRVGVHSVPHGQGPHPAARTVASTTTSHTRSLVGVASVGKPGAVRVIPGDAENSYLVHKLEGRSDIVGQRMPRTAGPFLTEGQMLIIRRWIDQGAQNN